MKIRLIDTLNNRTTDIAEEIKKICKKQKDGVLLSSRKLSEMTNRCKGTVLVNLDDEIRSTYSTMFKDRYVMRVWGNARTIQAIKDK